MSYISFFLQIMMGLVHYESSTKKIKPTLNMWSIAFFTFCFIHGFNQYGRCFTKFAYGFNAIFISQVPDIYLNLFQLCKYLWKKIFILFQEGYNFRESLVFPIIPNCFHIQFIFKSNIDYLQMQGLGIDSSGIFKFGVYEF